MQARRKNIKPPEKVAEGCDMWERGKAMQATLQEMLVKLPKT